MKLLTQPIDWNTICLQGRHSPYGQQPAKYAGKHIFDLPTPYLVQLVYGRSHPVFQRQPPTVQDAIRLHLGWRMVGYASRGEPLKDHLHPDEPVPDDVAYELTIHTRCTQFPAQQAFPSTWSIKRRQQLEPYANSCLGDIPRAALQTFASLEWKHIADIPEGRCLQDLCRKVLGYRLVGLCEEPVCAQKAS